MADNIDPYDINGTFFNSDLYLQKIFNKCTLTELLEKEKEITREHDRLYCNMQALVYENYNKFISASDTVSKIKTDFKEMEDEMDRLTENMKSITNCCDEISSKFVDTQSQMNKLSRVESLLKKQHFLLDLPTKMKSCMEKGNYHQIIWDYNYAKNVIFHPSNLESVQKIENECTEIVEDVKKILRGSFESKRLTAKQAADSIDLLIQLDEPLQSLSEMFLTYADGYLSEKLLLLSDLNEQDIIEFIDNDCSSFIGDLCQMITIYNDILINRFPVPVSHHGDLKLITESRLNGFISAKMLGFFQVLRSRIEGKQNENDTAIFVRTLDRLHRRFNAMHTLFSELNFTENEIELISKSAKRQCHLHLEALKVFFSDRLISLRQALVASENTNLSSLGEILDSSMLSIIDRVKTVIKDLLAFVQPELAFNTYHRFRRVFCQEYVRGYVVIGFLKHVADHCKRYCVASDRKLPPSFVLLLSKICHQFATSHIYNLLSATDDWCAISPTTSSKSRSLDEKLVSEMKIAGQYLANTFVRLQGLYISNMFRKSTETRNWIVTVEPRMARAVIKRVVEDVVALDKLVGTLYDEHSDSARSTDTVTTPGEKRTKSSKSIASNFRPIIRRIFSQERDIFIPTEISKTGIVSGIINISLKAFLECVRLNTFGRYGLQQLQVDIHFLLDHLSLFVLDQDLLQFMLSEILHSAVIRCLDPVSLAPSVVNFICEKW